MRRGTALLLPRLHVRRRRRSRPERLRDRIDLLRTRVQQRRRLPVLRLELQCWALRRSQMRQLDLDVHGRWGSWHLCALGGRLGHRRQPHSVRRLLQGWVCPSLRLVQSERCRVRPIFDVRPSRRQQRRHVSAHLHGTEPQRADLSLHGQRLRRADGREAPERFVRLRPVEFAPF